MKDEIKYVEIIRREVERFARTLEPKRIDIKRSKEL